MTMRHMALEPDARQQSCKAKVLRPKFIIAAIVGVAAVSGIFYLALKQPDASEASVPPSSVYFQVLGDWGRNKTFNQTVVAASMARIASEHQPLFIVSVGDNFYDFGVRSIDAPDFVDTYESVYLKFPQLRVPWWIIAGNHDYRGLVDVQVGYSQLSSYWNFPSRDYSNRVEVQPLSSSLRAGASSTLNRDDVCISMIYIDTNPFIKYYWLPPKYEIMKDSLDGTNTTQQLEWIESSLRAASTSCRWTIVIGHHPLYSYGLHGNHNDLIEVLQPLFDKYPVHAYLSGHDHDVQCIVKQNTVQPAPIPGARPARPSTLHFVTGGGSEVRFGEFDNPPYADAPYLADENGWLDVNVNATVAQFDMRNSDGHIVHTEYLRQ